MDVLIIGGGVFVGRHITDALLAAGHRVTHFNRGIAAPPRADVETITGDRMNELELLGNRSWDAVVDTCAYVPHAVRLSTEALATRVARYVFISTLSVYDYDRIGSDEPFDESAPRVMLAPGADATTMTPDTYGALKALCEDVVLDSFGNRATVLRCGLMVGPHDPTDRFTYWVYRCSRGGRMLAAGGPGTPMQFIDARDMAAFVVRVLNAEIGGVFNLTGQPDTVTFGALFSRCAQVSGVEPDVVWLDRDAVARAGLKEWQDVPLWLADGPFMRKFLNAAVDRALAAGLSLRPLTDTVRDTLAWANGRPTDYQFKYGLDAQREAEALATAGAPSSGRLD